MNLEEFQESDFDLLIKWIDSDELNYLWGCPAYVFPLTYEQIHSHCSKAEVFPYLLKVKGRHAGLLSCTKSPMSNIGFAVSLFQMLIVGKGYQNRC